MQIEQLIVRVDAALANEGAYPFLADIRKSLEQLNATPTSSAEVRSRLVAGLERLVLEDFGFSESALGGDLLAFADKYVKNGLF